jgi:hypothetical protein
MLITPYVPEPPQVDALHAPGASKLVMVPSGARRNP